MSKEKCIYLLYSGGEEGQDAAYKIKEILSRERISYFDYQDEENSNCKNSDDDLDKMSSLLEAIKHGNVIIVVLDEKYLTRSLDCLKEIDAILSIKHKKLKERIIPIAANDSFMNYIYNNSDELKTNMKSFIEEQKDKVDKSVTDKEKAERKKHILDGCKYNTEEFIDQLNDIRYWIKGKTDLNSKVSIVKKIKAVKNKQEISLYRKWLIPIVLMFSIFSYIFYPNFFHSLIDEKKYNFSQKSQQADELLQDGDYNKSREIYKKLNKNIWNINNKLKAREQLSRIDIRSKNWESAKDTLTDYISILKIQKNRDLRFEIANAYRGKGIVYYNLEDYPKAEKLFFKSINIFHEITNRKDVNYKKKLSKALKRYADCRYKIPNYKVAGKNYKEACELKYGAACTSLGLLYEKGQGFDQNYTQASIYYDKACSYGDSWGCLDLALAYQYGRGHKVSPINALKYYKKTIEGKNKQASARAYLKIGYMHEIGEIGQKDLKKAKKYYQMSCDKNNSYGCNQLGNCYRDGKGTTRDYKQAHIYYNKSCDLGSGDACTNLGLLYERGQGTEQNITTALIYYKKACEFNNGWGCFNAGQIYRSAKKGILQDYKQAFGYYTKASKKNNIKAKARAIANLGHLCEKGYGIEKDIANAKSKFVISCEMNNSYGCNMLGYFYREGKVGEQDYKKAGIAYLKSCKYGSGSACTSYGALYDNAQGVDMNNTKAFNYYLKGCELDNGWGCMNTAYCYETGKGVDKDEEKAIYYYTLSAKRKNKNAKRDSLRNLGYLYEFSDSIYKDLQKSKLNYKDSCDLNSSIGCNNLGIFYREGKDGNVNYQEAKKLFTKSCQLGSSDGCNNLGSLYYNGQGVDQNYTIAMDYYKIACSDGNGLSCENLGQGYRDGLGVKKDCKKAKEKFDIACENGIDDACTHIGYLYEIGCGVKQDYKEAFNRYDKLCDNNNSWACNKQAYLYQFGKGVEENKTITVKLYDKACDTKHYYSCSKAGEMYRHGEGVKQDFKKANKRFKLACEHNEQDGCTNIAYSFEFAQGVEQDYEKALDRYKKSCENSNGWGCNNLGTLYHNGDVIEKDLRQAWQYYTKSCSLEFSYGCTNLMKLYLYNDVFDDKKEEIIKAYDTLENILGDTISSDENYETILKTLKKLYKHKYLKLKEITLKFIKYLKKLDNNTTSDLAMSYAELSNYNITLGESDLALKNIDDALFYYRQLDEKVYARTNKVINFLLFRKANRLIGFRDKDSLSKVLSELEQPLILDINKLKLKFFKEYLETGILNIKLMNKINNYNELSLDDNRQYLGQVGRIIIQGVKYMGDKEYLKAFEKYDEAFKISIREFKLHPLDYLGSVTNSIESMASVSMSFNIKIKDVLKNITRVKKLFIDANNTKIYDKYISKLFFVKSELLGTNNPKYKQSLENALEYNKAEPKNDKYYKYVIDINNKLGHYYKIRGQLDEAQKRYEISFKNISKIKNQKDRANEEFIAKYNKSIIFMLKHRYSNALFGFKDTLTQYNELVSKYKIDIDYNNLADIKSKILVMHIVLNNKPAFKKEYDEFVKFYNDHSSNIYKYLRVYIRDFASIFVDEDRVVQAIELYVKFIENFENDKYLKDNKLAIYNIVNEINYLVELYRKNNDFNSVIENLKKIILLYKGKEYNHAIPDVYKELGKSYMHISIDNEKNAIKYYIKAIEGYKNIIKSIEAENDSDSQCYIKQQKAYIVNLEQCVSNIEECNIKEYHIAYQDDGCNLYTEKEWEALKIGKLNDDVFEQYGVDADESNLTEAVEPIR